MDHIQIVLVSLLVAVAGLSALATRIGVPYPILLVLGGLAMGFIPGIPDVQLEPELVLVVFLPPLLYGAAFFTSVRELRAEAVPIVELSVGLVLATTITVAVTAHLLIEGLPWAACFALGAIVAPTDPVAATTILRRLGVPRRTVAVVEGESLVNDASALVAYKIAVGAIVGGTFSLADAGLRFVVAAAGGAAIGYVVALVMAAIRRRLNDVTVSVTMSLLTGYAAYIPADAVGASGVVAAVTAGVAMGWWAPRIVSPEVRQQGFAFWTLLTFLLNATLFVLVGLQLPSILDGLRGESVGWLLGTATAIALVVTGTRLLAMNTLPMLIRAVDRGRRRSRPPADWRERLVAVWSGMRGAVSLAAALALPAATPQRDLLIFLTFAVIFETLVIQGLTLPEVIRRLGVHEDGADEQREELKARMLATRAALARIEALGEEPWTRDDTIERLRAMYDYRQRRLKARAGKIDDDGYEDRSVAYQTIVREVLEAQRTTIVALRNEGVISNEVMHRIERELDLEDQRLEI